MNDRDTLPGNPDFSRILDARLSRRSLLKGSLATAAVSYVGAGSLLLSPVGDAQAAMRQLKLNFNAVPKGLDDVVRLPSGYKFMANFANVQRWASEGMTWNDEVWVWWGDNDGVVLTS